ncbi:hypothetical protein NDU88_008310 [Pleurodeles waltl]|uniref:Uncharacterized protein n=1 Tax=Pleurodeles waltl TaxID=8319 RepID=A0AAV7PW89_PLEWA|nr:hypothetical protein NDU88_008310 [Pleurodeles waltl]
MAYYADEEDSQLDLQNNQEEYQMEECLVEALGYDVQDSMNWAVIKALKPFILSLVRFGNQSLWEAPVRMLFPLNYPFKTLTHVSDPQQGGSSSADILAQMAASVLRDHECEEAEPQGPGSGDTSFDTSIHTTDSDKSEYEPRIK